MINAIGSSEAKARLNSNFAKLGTNQPLTIKDRSDIPTPLPSEQKQGVITNKILTDYFDGDVWLFPNLDRRYDFETIITPKEFSFRLYNSSKDAKMLQSIIINTNGLELEGITAPYEFQGLEEVSLTLKASSQGDLEINSNISFVFENQLIILSITGTRAIILTFSPGLNYSESEMFQTDIFTSQNGRERREQIVTNPKRYVEYDITAINNMQVSSLEELITYAMRYYFLQPLWFSRTYILQDSNSTLLNCNTENCDFKVGELVLIMRTPEEYQFAKVVSFTTSSITVDKEILALKGMSVIPLLKSHPQNSNSYTFTNSNISSWTLSLKEIL